MPTYRIIHFVIDGSPTDRPLVHGEEFFSERVNTWLRDGWKLQGGHSLNVATIYGGKVEYTFSQSVYKD